MRVVLFLVFVFTSTLLYQNCGSPSSNLASSPSVYPIDPLPDDGDNNTSTATPELKTISPYGQVYFYLGGEKGVILCFHGTGGSAEGWTKDDKLNLLNDMKQSGYSFICPSSVNRGDGTSQNPSGWDPLNTAANPDVLNVDGLLNYFKINDTTPLFIVGHSNGVGFTSRYAVLSTFQDQIKAVQLSNATGITSIIAKPEYTFPSLFNYATCDGTYDKPTYDANAAALNSKTPPVPYLMNNITARYIDPNQCHDFMNTSPTTLSFFDRFLPTQNKYLTFSKPVAGDANIKNEADGIGIDAQGNLFMSGPFSGQRTFDGQTLKSVGLQDAYVVKLRPSDGKLLKKLIISSSDLNGVENIYDAVVDEVGNVYINGSFSRDISIGDPTVKTISLAANKSCYKESNSKCKDSTGKLLQPLPEQCVCTDHFLAKLDNNLNVIWAKKFGGEEDDGGNEIAMTDENTLVLTAMSDSKNYTPWNGTSTASWPAGSSVAACNDKDGFVLRVNATDGSVKSVIQIGGTKNQQIRAIAGDPNGHILVGLEYDGTATLGSVQIPAMSASTTNPGYRAITDGALFYIGPDNVLKWAKSISSDRYDNFRAAGFDSDGNIYVSGVHSNLATLKTYNPSTKVMDIEVRSDKTPIAPLAIDGANSYNQFVMKYTPEGTISWYRRFGLSDKMISQGGGELDVSSDNRVYISGGFRNKLTLNNLDGRTVNSVYLLPDTGVDSTAVVVLNSAGLFQESLYYKGTNTTDDKQGNSASAMITTRLINGHTYLGLGVVLEAVGPLTITTNSATFNFADTSSTTREFSAALYVK